VKKRKRCWEKIYRKRCRGKKKKGMKKEVIEKEGKKWGERM
jgi:hypothetical protein